MTDLRLAIRSLARAPIFAAAVILTIALGIGATTAAFSVVYGVLFRPLPYPEADRLVAVWQTRPRNPNATDQAIDAFMSVRAFVSDSLLKTWQREARCFEEIGGFAPQGFSVTAGGEVQRVDGAIVTSPFFKVLGARPLFGRLLHPEDDEPGRGEVIVLGFGFWQQRFGGDPNIIGRTVTIDGAPHLVVGVLRADFHLVLQFAAHDRDPALYAPVSHHFRPGIPFVIMPGTIARLRRGTSVSAAQAEMTAVMRHLAETDRRLRGHGAFVAPLSGEAVETADGARRGVFILLAATACVLLIGCVNVANLLLVRAATRRRELAVRAALGAGRWRIVRQVVVESVVLSAVGGLGGLLLAAWGTDLLVALTPKGLFPRIEDVRVDAGVLAFGFAVSVLAGLLAGLAPAWYTLARDRRGTLIGALRDGQRAGAGGRGPRLLRRALVTAEVMLAMVLLVAAALLARTYVRLVGVDLGVQPEHVLTFHVNFPPTRYPTPESRALLAGDLLNRLRALAGVRAAGAATSLPVWSGYSMTGPMAADDQPITNQSPRVSFNLVTPGFFEAAGIRLASGRVFGVPDARSDVVILSRAALRQFWPHASESGSEAVGHALKDGQRTYRIAGVVDNVKYSGSDAATSLEIYVPYFVDPSDSVYVMLRTAGDPMALVPAVRTVVREIDGDMPLEDVQALEQVVADTVAPQRFRLAVIGGFALLALLLATIGLYGVVAQSVAQRTQEIGICLALGAGQPRIVRMILTEAVLLTGVGIVAGVVVSLAATRVLSSFLFGVTASDSTTYAFVAVTLLAVAVAACLAPARHASAIDPVVALRDEG